MQKSLIVLVVGMLAVGCGKTEQKQATTEEPTPTTNTNKVSGPRVQPDGDVDLLVKELTPEEKKVVGTYELELKKFGETHRYVLLDNSTVEYYLNGKKEEAEHKWSIVDKEVHIERENRAVSVFSINKDESITGIATIDEDGKRKEILKEHQYTREKIKLPTHAPPPERSLEVQFLDGELNGTDLEEVKKLDLDGYQLTELPKGLEKLTQLTKLDLASNPGLTKAQIDQLKKALPNCEVSP